MERLPTELLETIFSNSVTQNSPDSCSISTNADISDGRTWPCIMDIEKGPWALSQVCMMWREIVFGTPSLWKRFTLSAKDLRVNERPVAAQSALEQWLSYTGNLPISFLIQTGGICDVPGAQDLLRLLLAQSSRWENVEVINGSWSFWAILGTYERQSPAHEINFSSLRSITYLSEGENDQYTDLGATRLAFNPRFYDVFRNSTLESISLQDYLSFEDIAMPWSNITEYEGSSRVAAQDHLQLLSKTPNLQSCTITIASPLTALRVQRVSSEAFITLGKLEEFRLVITSNAQRAHVDEDDESEEPGDGCSAFIRMFIFPALKRLSLDNETGDVIPDMFPACEEMLESSMARLEVLDIAGHQVGTDMDIPDVDFIRFLGASSSVQRFSLGGWKTINRVSRVLSEHEELLPLLQRLTFHIPEPFIGADLSPNLERILQSRSGVEEMIIVYGASSSRRELGKSSVSRKPAIGDHHFVLGQRYNVKIQEKRIIKY